MINLIGQCLDHIYVKDSNIPQAGKGAFARRPIVKGDVIIPGRFSLVLFV